MNIFHILEIVDLGIEKEKKRRDFYALVAEKFKDKDFKELFGNLRDWEENHIKKFTQIKDSLTEEQSTEGYPGELSAYMQIFVSGRLYSDITPSKFSQMAKTKLDALTLGMEFEKDAILFFTELLNYTIEKQTQVIQLLINEEKQHLVYLSELRKKIG